MQRRPRTNDWASGFTAELALTNRSTTPLDGWTLTYAYSGDQKLTNGWNGTWSQSGKTVSVAAAAWSRTVAAGAAVTAGAQFTYSGTNAAPTYFAVNGTPCTGAHQPPVAVLTSPAPGAVHTVGDPVPLAATAAAADGATIGKVEFYSDTTLLGADTTAPFSLGATGLGVGPHSLYARAYDSLGAAAEPAPVGITVAAGPALVAAPGQLSVRRGETGAFELKLSTQPAANVTVGVARTSGNTDRTAMPTALTFTPANWNTGQKVTVAAGSTGTGSAVFTATAPATRRPRSALPSWLPTPPTTPASSTSTGRSPTWPTATSHPRASRTTPSRR